MVSTRKRRPTRSWLMFQCLEPVIESLLKEGYSPRQIHDVLSSEGYLSIPYKTFFSYLRRVSRRTDESKLAFDEDTVMRAFDVMESVKRQAFIEYDLKQIYQGLVKCGVKKISYSAFCEFIQDDKKLLPGRIMDDDFVFTDDDGFYLLTEKVATLLSTEADYGYHGITNQEEK